VNVAAGATLNITVTLTAGYNAVLSGIFLGDAAPPTAPGAPAVAATSGNATVHLSWPVPGDGGSPITGFKVYRGTSPGGELAAPLATLAANATAYDDNAVTNGTTYYYQVAAVNAIGETRSGEKFATPALSPYTSAPQGSWVNKVGADGYVLGAWNAASSDLKVLPAGATFTLDRGARFCWACPSGDVRALQSPDQTERRAGTYYDATQIGAHLTFSSAYSGTLRLYAVDWNALARRESITVNDGSGPRSVDINTDFSQGAWISFPVNVAAGATLNITVTLTAGYNAVLSGIFLN
jgi:hypothetical protein